MKIKMNAFERKILGKCNIYQEGKTVINPYSKVQVYLSAEALSVYDVILGCERLLHKLSDGMTVTLVDIDKTEEIFFVARDVFRKNWPDEFMKLID